MVWSSHWISWRPCFLYIYLEGVFFSDYRGLDLYVWLPHTAVYSQYKIYICSLVSPIIKSGVRKGFYDLGDGMVWLWLRTHQKLPNTACVNPMCFWCVFFFKLTHKNCMPVLCDHIGGHLSKPLQRFWKVEQLPIETSWDCLPILEYVHILQIFGAELVGDLVADFCPLS